MGFLLSLFFAVPVGFQHTGLLIAHPVLGFLPVPLPLWELLLSWVPAVLGLFRVEVVSARVNPSHGTIEVTRVYVPRFFVSSQQRFGVTDIKAPSACHSSQVLDRPCYSSQVSNGPCYSS